MGVDDIEQNQNQQQHQNNEAPTARCGILFIDTKSKQKGDHITSIFTNITGYVIVHKHNHVDTTMCLQYISTTQFMYNGKTKKNKNRVWTSKGGTSTHKVMNNKSGYLSARMF